LVKGRIALEHLAAASALAGRHILAFLLGVRLSHDWHAGSLPGPRRVRPWRSHCGRNDRTVEAEN